MVIKTACIIINKYNVNSVKHVTLLSPLWNDVSCTYDSTINVLLSPIMMTGLYEYKHAGKCRKWISHLTQSLRAAYYSRSLGDTLALLSRAFLHPFTMMENRFWTLWNVLIELSRHIQIIWSLIYAHTPRQTTHTHKIQSVWRKTKRRLR